MYRGTMLSARELEALRQIEDVVRLGRVRRIETDRIVLEHGETDTGPDVLHVDCTALGLNNAPATPIFQPGRIVLQQVRHLSPCFNAALIGFVEAHRDDDADKNRLCPPNPYPSSIEDWPRHDAAARGRPRDDGCASPTSRRGSPTAGSTCCARFPTTRPSPPCRRRSSDISPTSRTAIERLAQLDGSTSRDSDVSPAR